MTSVPFNIPITDDIVFEGDENFMLTIDPSLATFVSVGTPDEATVTIVDDDRKQFYIATILTIFSCNSSIVTSNEPLNNSCITV